MLLGGRSKFSSSPKGVVLFFLRLFYLAEELSERNRSINVFVSVIVIPVIIFLISFIDRATEQF